MWDAIAGKLIRTLEGHSEAVSSVAFSPDGLMIVSGSGDKTIRLWNTNTGKLVRTLEGCSDCVYSFVFNSNGGVIASAENHSKTIRLWNAGTSKLLRMLDGHTEDVNSVAFSPHGLMVASGSSDETIKLWNASTGKLLRTLNGEHPKGVNSVVYSPDGRMVASGSDGVSPDKTIKLWDASTGKLVRTLDGHSNDVSAVAFSPNGKMVVSGSRDKTAKLWDVSTGKLARTLEGHSNDVSSVAFSPNSHIVASGSNDKKIKLWDVGLGKLVRTLDGHSGSVNTVLFSPDGQMVVSGSDDKTIKLWEANTGNLIRTLEGHLGSVSFVAISANGKLIATGSDDHTIKLWETSTGNLVRTWQGHSGGIREVSFSPDGRMVVSGSNDKTIKLWEVDTGNLIRTLHEHSDSVNSVAFSPDGRVVLSGGKDGKIHIWSAQKGELLLTIIHTSGANGLAYTTDEYYVCTPTIERHVKWLVDDQVYENEKYKVRFNKPEIIAARLRSLTVEPAAIASAPPSSNTNTSVSNADTPKAPPPAPKDTTSPKIMIISPPLTRGQSAKPAANQVLKQSGSSLTVAGQALDESGVKEVTVRGATVRLDERGNFSAEVPLQVGDNPITVTATDNYGNRASESFTVRRESEPPPLLVATGRNFALVIGNNRYPNLPADRQLKTAIHDAQEVAKLLKADFGFETTLLTDAKRVGIINALNEYRRSLKPDDNLLIYYAGHGHFDDETKKAYWIPADADLISPANWIIADEVTSTIRAIPSRHILIVSDSCYSGTLTRATDFRLSTPAEHERYLEKMRGGTSRILMASGGNEPVADGGGGSHSVFARALLDGLHGMEERAFTAEELFYRFIKERVAGKSEQAPEYRYIQASGHESGDFVFVRVK
ncbi:MAG TPA: caspase family protein [Blastocatellia bacterium]|nr:caspase family protein [Blastocatellia bacterium]